MLCLMIVNDLTPLSGSIQSGEKYVLSIFALPPLVNWKKKKKNLAQKKDFTSIKVQSNQKTNETNRTPSRSFKVHRVKINFTTKQCYLLQSCDIHKFHLNNYFNFHFCLSIRHSVSVLLSIRKLTPIPVVLSLVCVKSEKYAFFVTLRPLGA